MRVKGYRRTTKSGKTAQVREFERRGMAAREKPKTGKSRQGEEDAGQSQVAQNKFVKKAAGMVMSAMIRQGLKKAQGGWAGFDKIDYRKVAREMKAKVKGFKPDDPRFQAVSRVLKDLKALNDKYGDGRGLKEPEPTQPPQQEGQGAGQQGGQTQPQGNGAAPPKQAVKAVEEEKKLDTESDNQNPSGDDGGEAGAQTEPQIAPEEYMKEFQDHVIAVQRRKYESFVSYKAEKFGDKLIAEGVKDYIIVMPDLATSLFSDEPTVAYMIRAEHDRHGENILGRVLSRIGPVPYMVEPIAMTIRDTKGHLREEVESEAGNLKVGRRYMFCLGFKPDSENQVKALLRVLVQAAKTGTGREVDAQSGKKPFVICNVLENLPGAVKVKIYAKKVGGQMVMSANKGPEQQWDREDEAVIYAKGPIAVQKSK